MRLLVGIVFVVACGGSKAPPPPAARVAAVVVDAAPVEVIDAGAAPQVAVASDPEEGGQIARAGDIAASPNGLTGQGGLGESGWIGAGVGGGASIGTGGSKVSGRGGPGAQIKVGDPKVKGKLDSMIVRRYLRRNQMKMRYCYEKQLLAKPGLAGKLIASYAIDPAGLVHGATAKGIDDELDACVASVLDGIEYPKPPDGGAVSVTFTITYTNK